MNTPENNNPEAVSREAESAVLEEIDNRDRWEEWATKLAEAVGKHLGEDVGEHSSASCPVEAALRLLDESESVAALREDKARLARLNHELREAFARFLGSAQEADSVTAPLFDRAFGEAQRALDLHDSALRDLAASREPFPVCTPEGNSPEIPESSRTMILTVREIKDLAEFSGLTLDKSSTTTDLDDIDAEIAIADCPPAGLKPDDDEEGAVVTHYRKIAYFTEYPEEGAMGLGEEIKPGAHPVSGDKTEAAAND